MDEVEAIVYLRSVRWITENHQNGPFRRNGWITDIWEIWHRGDLDPTSGTASDGTPDVIVNLSLRNGNDFGKPVAVQNDGKVVVVGLSEQDGSTNIELIRLRKDGSLDTTFGTANDGTVDGVVNIDLGPGNDVGTGVAIDRKSGKIVVSGYHTVSGSSNMIAARLRALNVGPSSSRIGLVTPSCHSAHDLVAGHPMGDGMKGIEMEKDRHFKCGR